MTTQGDRFFLYKKLIDHFQPRAKKRFEPLKQNETLRDLYDKTKLIINFTYPYRLDTYELNHEVFSKMIDSELNLVDADSRFFIEDEIFDKDIEISFGNQTRVDNFLKKLDNRLQSRIERQKIDQSNSTLVNVVKGRSYQSPKAERHVSFNSKIRCYRCHPNRVI